MFYIAVHVALGIASLREGRKTQSLGTGPLGLQDWGF
jgi:hypothetical protein